MKFTLKYEDRENIFMDNTTDLKRRISETDHFYFVCSGNIIRSAFCELLAKDRGIKKVSSFGTTYQNSTIHGSSDQALRDRRIDTSLIDTFRPTHIDDISGFKENSIFFVMTNDHYHSLLHSHRNIDEDDIFFVTELIGDKKEVADPYFNGNYEETFQLLESCIKQLIEFSE